MGGWWRWGIEKGVIHDSLALLMIQSKTVAERERECLCTNAPGCVDDMKAAHSEEQDLT